LPGCGLAHDQFNPELVRNKITGCEDWKYREELREKALRENEKSASEEAL